MNLAIERFIQAQDYFEALAQHLLSEAPSDLAGLNRELLAAFTQMETLARVVAGVELTTPGFAEI